MEANYNKDELKEIAPVVANLDKQNLYFVPAGYFDSLAESAISYIRLTQLKANANLYFVPAAYFDSLPELIMSHIKLTQLKEDANPYSVPAGYFENLADSVLNKIHLVSNDVYKELSDIAPLLNTVNKSNVFAVPEGYFEKLPAAVNPEPKASKVISIGSHIRKWVTYAAAASVLFIVATTAYLYVNIHGRNFQMQLPVEQRISQLNEQDIMNYLKDNDGITSGDLISSPDEQDPEIQHLLKNASDEDIENYLDEYSDPNEQPAKGI